MRLPRWFLSVLVIALAVAVGTWINAGDDAAPGVAQAPPERAASPSPFPSRDRIQAQAQAPQSARVARIPGASQGKAPQTTVVQPDTRHVLSPLPSFDQRALAEEHRYSLRGQPANAPDEHIGPLLRKPPWFAAYDYNLELYRDARQSRFRQPRDLYRRRAGRWMDDICPWTKPRRTWSAQGRIPWQMKPPRQHEQFQRFSDR